MMVYDKLKSSNPTDWRLCGQFELNTLRKYYRPFNIRLRTLMERYHVRDGHGPWPWPPWLSPETNYSTPEVEVHPGNMSSM